MVIERSRAVGGGEGDGVSAEEEEATRELERGSGDQIRLNLVGDR